MYHASLTFRQALQKGYAKIESRPYLDRVKTLPCCGCEAPAPSDPHHLYGVGFKGAGTKSPDVWAIPLCRLCHDELHHSPPDWEDKYGTQWAHAALTLARLWHDGEVGIL